jgi:hypothetical protein
MVALRSPDPSVMLCVEAEEAIPDQKHGKGRPQALSLASVSISAVRCQKTQIGLDK